MMDKEELALSENFPYFNVKLCGRLFQQILRYTLVDRLICNDNVFHDKTYSI
jgi:hypothetical protein